MLAVAPLPVAPPTGTPVPAPFTTEQLADLNEALEALGVAFVITPAAELDRCEFCPPLDGPAADGVAVLARRAAASRWTVRETVCPACLAYAVRDVEAAGDTEVRVEVPVGAA